MPGVIFYFEGSKKFPILDASQGPKENPWDVLFSDNELKVERYLADVLQGRKLDTFFDIDADKRPDVIHELISAFYLNPSFHKQFKNGAWVPVPIGQHRGVIQKVLQVLSPEAKERYEGQLANAARNSRLRALGEPNVYGFSGRREPADPATVQRKYHFTNIGTLAKQIPTNLASEIRQRGRTIAVKNAIKKTRKTRRARRKGGFLHFAPL